MDDLATGTLRRTARPRLLSLAAVLIAISGALDVVYAPFVVVVPFLDRPTPALFAALGVTCLAAAGGIWSVRGWGRLLGVALSVWGVTYWLVEVGAGIVARDDMAELVAAAAVSLFWVAVLDGVPLWILLRRWPAKR